MFTHARPRVVRCLGACLIGAAGSAPALGGGACCKPDGTCQVLSAINCQVVNHWIWKGEGTTCNTAGCIAYKADSSVAPPAPIPDSLSPDSPGPTAFVDIAEPATFPVSFVAASCFVQHPRQGDLRVVLRHLSTGTAVVLIDRPGWPQIPGGFAAPNFGASPAQLFETIDAGAMGQYDVPGVPPPGMAGVVGEWQPASPLSAFAGENSAGIWRLEVTDFNPGNTGFIAGFELKLGLPGGACYANCDGSTTAPTLTVADFACFLNRYAAGDPLANCDGSTGAPLLTIADFACFLNRYAAGCP